MDSETGADTVTVAATAGEDLSRDDCCSAVFDDLLPDDLSKELSNLLLDGGSAPIWLHV